MTTKIEKPNLTNLIDDDYTDMVNRMAYNYASMYGGRHAFINQDDLASEGWLATVKAYSLYDPLKGKFRSYAYIYVDRSMLAYCNKFRFQLSAGSRDLRTNMPDIKEAHSGLIRIDDVDIPYTPTSNDGIDLDDFFCEGFTTVDKNMIRDRFINGLKLREIADKNEMSLSGVYSKIRKLTHQLRERGQRYIDEEGNY